MQDASDKVENAAQDAVNNAVSLDNILNPIIAKLESEKDIFLDGTEFAKYFKEELQTAGLNELASSLHYKMEASRQESAKLQKEIESYNTERFQILENFVHEQERKNGKSQNVIDMLRNNNSELLATATDI